MIVLMIVTTTLLVRGQTLVQNRFTTALEITFPGRGAMTIPAGDTRQVSELAGEVKGIKCRYQENGRTKTYRITKTVVSGKLVFGPSDLVTTSPSMSSPGNNNANTGSNANPSPDPNLKGELQQVHVVDSSKYRFYVMAKSGYYPKISLEPGQMSDSIPMPLGLNHMTIMVDMDTARSTGRNFAQTVVKFILVADQKYVVVTDSNIVKLVGEDVKINLRSGFPYKIVFVNKDLVGKSLKPGGKLKKINLSYGFNTFSIQYLDGGIKYQADLETIVAEGDFTIVIGKDNLRNIVQIGVGYSTF